MTGFCFVCLIVYKLRHFLACNTVLGTPSDLLLCYLRGLKQAAIRGRVQPSRASQVRPPTSFPAPLHSHCLETGQVSCYASKHLPGFPDLLVISFTLPSTWNTPSDLSRLGLLSFQESAQMCSHFFYYHAAPMRPIRTTVMCLLTLSAKFLQDRDGVLGLSASPVGTSCPW